MRWIQLFDRLRLKLRPAVLRARDQKRPLATALAALCCLFAAGCAPVASPTGDLLLENDDLVEGPDGLLLGAIGTSLPAPLPVWIEQIEVPGAPLPEAATAISPIYSFGAEQTTSAPGDATFALAIPIPPGIDSANLGIATLVQRSSFIDAPGDGAVWLPLTGILGTQGNYLTVAINALTESGSTVVLIEHPDMAPISPSEGVRTATTRESASEVEFDVRCYGISVVTSKCTPKVAKLFEQYLQEAYDVFAEHGYVDSDPRDGGHLRYGLHLRYECVAIDSPGAGFKGCDTGEAPRYRDIWIAPPNHKLCKLSDDSNDSQLAFGAYYVPRSMAIVYCYLIEGYTDSAYKVASNHELFHAFQHGFPNVRDDMMEFADVAARSADDEYWWVIEGTASAVHTEINPLRRATLKGFDFRPVDWPLTYRYKPHTTVETLRLADYRTQDFWVYLGLTKGIGLQDLAGLFQLGVDVKAVNAFLSGPASAGSLADQYWAWVMNQAMEKEVEFDEKFTVAPCQIDTAFARPRELYYPETSAADGAIQDGETTGTLSRLNARLFRLLILKNLGPVRVTAYKSGGEGELRYKIYTSADEDCGQGPGDSPRRINPEGGSYPSVYILLGNVGRERGTSLEYTIAIQLL